MFQFSRTPTLEKLRQDHENFNDQKMKMDEWKTPRNLFFALIGELGKLAVDAAANASFVASKDEDKYNDGIEEEEENASDGQKEDKPKVEAILSELADVFSYLICLAHVCQVDLALSDTTRPPKPDSTFTDTAWNEIEVTAFYLVNLPDKNNLLEDVLRLSFAVSNLCDFFQWTVVENNLTNMAQEKQTTVDKFIKDIFCHVVVLASKYEYDLPRLMREKNLQIAEKYSESVGKLTKDDVISRRYSDLPCFYASSRENISPSYPLDSSVKKSDISVNLLLSNLMESIGLIAEIFQWDTDGSKTQFFPAKHAHLTYQLASIIDSIRNIAQYHKIILSEAFTKKILMNRSKYPVALCQGSSDKYSEYCNENISSIENTSELNTATENILLSVDNASQAMSTFVNDREWQKYHTPRNISIALFGEIGEVIELFMEKRGNDFLVCLGDELADCVAYGVRLASVCDVDFTAALLHYFPE